MSNLDPCEEQAATNYIQSLMDLGLAASEDIPKLFNFDYRRGLDVPPHIITISACELHRLKAKQRRAA